MPESADNLYDAVIVGGGPSGLTAAIYLARARYRVLVVEKEKTGGQITITADVVNYPGLERVSGEELTDVMRKQATNFGAEFLAAEVRTLSLDGPVKTVTTSAGDLRTFGIVLAPGAQPRMVGFDGEAKYKGRGVAYCATCDGEFFTGLEVLVVGGGAAAAEESVFLTKYAKHVTILVRGDAFKCDRVLVEQVEANPKITVRYHTTLDRVDGDTVLRSAQLRDTATNETTDYAPPSGETFGVFVFAGYQPATEFLQGTVELTDAGYIVTDANLKTAVDGVYAAGDVRVKPLRQVVTAVADGAIAATELERHIARMQTETGFVPRPPHAVSSLPAAEPAPAAEPPAAPSGAFLSADMRAQLHTLFGKMEHPIELRASLDERPISTEVRGFLGELTQASDQITSSIDEAPTGLLPSIALWREGQATGLSFHGVPGGHEFNSFVIGIYNAGGPGQPIDDATLARIAAIDKPTDIKVFVSLSCTMCPTTVTSAQQIAARNPLVTAAVYDLNHFPELRQQYSVMSVPCMVVNDHFVTFGKMAVPEVLDAIASADEVS